ncbi:MAG: ABC transporter permease [Methanobacteriaceae archaeon]
MFDHRFISNFTKYRFLLKELVKRDIKAKYRNSALGILWSFLNPLLTMVVFTLIFSTLFSRTIPNFPVYVLTGRLLYEFFAGSTRASMKSIRSNSNIMKNIYVPKYIYALSSIFSEFINFLISLIVLIGVMVATGASFSLFNFTSIIPIILVLILSIGCGLILATVNVFFRDLEYIYSVFTMILMYGSALFYPIDIIPEKFLPLFYANPVYAAISGFRDAILYQTFPAMSTMLYLAIFGIVSLIIGVTIFYKYQDKFIFYVW